MRWRIVRSGVLVAAFLSAVAVAGAATAGAFHGPGIVLQPPTGWYVTNEPLNRVTDPVQRLMLSSYRIPGDADAGGSYVPSPTGVIAQLDEELPSMLSADWRARPVRFTLPRLGGMETLNGDRWGERIFRDHGRDFYLFVWVGRHASSSQVVLLLRALDGMRITAS